ncbi:MAG: exodeoxyribonuclease VII large subunit [Caldilineaceae bacterium]|nr:exodeoxyribonuclease VII large subunit [Caldilineaceae bacterium]MDE0339712.1 exodeoxyribonuclease VII large subunit [Caldilineaceae bacterium]
MNPLTITQLTAHVTSLFERDELLRDVWVLAEVSRWTRAASGHIYFSMKDSGAVINSLMWRGNAHRHAWLPNEGDQILAHGHVTVYPERGQYQFYADEIRPAGRGQLYAQFEALKERLAAEGLFEEERKRPIPVSPRRLGIVTSQSAAAFQDVLRVLRQRWPLADSVLFPTQVQGAEAPGQIVAALAAANMYTTKEGTPRDSSREDLAGLPLLFNDNGSSTFDSEPGHAWRGDGHLDTILLVRGGGSIEDLWAFNEEAVAYAVAGSNVPVVTGIGHETDFTIADFVADLRAPTPTGAAVAATPDRWEMLDGVKQTRLWLLRAGSEEVSGRKVHWQELRRRLVRSAPLRQIDLARQRLDEVEERLTRVTSSELRRRKEQLESGKARLEGLNPSGVLSRGYSIVQKSDGTVVSAPGQTSIGERLQVRSAGGAYPVQRESD